MGGKLGGEILIPKITKEEYLKSITSMTMPENQAHAEGRCSELEKELGITADEVAEAVYKSYEVAN